MRCEAVDGVEVCLETAISDERAGIDLPAGCQVLGGADALGYVRSRYTDPDGDLGRVERQRQFVAALAERATSPAVLLNPLRAVPLAAAVGFHRLGPFVYAFVLLQIPLRALRLSWRRFAASTQGSSSASGSAFRKPLVTSTFFRPAARAARQLSIVYS